MVNAADPAWHNARRHRGRRSWHTGIGPLCTPRHPHVMGCAAVGDMGVYGAWGVWDVGCMEGVLDVGVYRHRVYGMWGVWGMRVYGIWGCMGCGVV